LPEDSQFSVDIIARGIEACLLNANELLQTAKEAMSLKRHGLALSLAVLAMEEVGKLIAIDGLSFAKPGDDRRGIAQNAQRYHRLKLGALDVYPLFLNYFAMLDPRYHKEPRFRETLGIILVSYKKQRHELEPWLGSACDLRQLDEWKQRGFYTHIDQVTGQVRRPSDIDRAFSDCVFQLAFRIVDSMNFVLRENISRYEKQIQSIRESLTDLELQQIKERAKEIVGAVFRVD